jgi:hypothetical protein
VFLSSILFLVCLVQLKANHISSTPPPPPTTLPAALAVMVAMTTATVTAAGAVRTTIPAAAAGTVTALDTYTTHKHQLKAAAEDTAVAAAVTRG